MSLRKSSIPFILSFLFFFKAAALKPWPECLPVIEIGSVRHDCMLYPFHEVDVDPQKSDACSKNLIKTFHPYLDRKYEYKLNADKTLSLTKMNRIYADSVFTDVTKCFLGSDKPLTLTYSGVVIIPLGRNPECDYRVIWMEDGRVKYDNTYDHKGFLEKVTDNEKRLSAGEMSIRMMLNEYFHGDWSSPNNWPHND